MNTCRLDTLPVELVHHLLNYFSAHEIFSTFTNVTSYIDAILAAYTNYRVNFKAIARSNFDLVCQHMRPNQVMALNLSDDEDTPGLIGLFLSRFQINQFTRLQALTLIEIGADFWKSIIIPMSKLEHLRSFRFFPSNRSDQWVCNLHAHSVTQLDKDLFDSYAPILSQLYQIRLCHGDFLHSIQFPHLRHLVLERSTVDVIKHIAVAALQLKSLDTSLSLDALPTELIYPITQLNCLFLRIDGLPVSMNVLERMMSNLSRLKHLELIASCGDDVIDGQRWQTKVENLVTFNFKFHISYVFELQRLDSFRNSFWLEEKQWFVAYADGAFFSVPHFTAREADDSFTIPQYTTVPDDGMFYQHIKKLQLTKKSSHMNDHFSHVHTLTLYSAPPLSTIKKIVDLCEIENLILRSWGENISADSLINEMPKLCQISITCDVEDFLQEVGYKALEKIRILEIGNIIMNTDHDNIDHLCAVFPNIRHLKVNNRCSIKQIFAFLNRFKHLSTTSFRCISWYHDADEQQSRHNIQSTLDQMRSAQVLNYTYRFDQSRVYFWI